MWNPIKRWKVNRGRARSDAFDLVVEHGTHAYAVAREMARAERLGRLISPSLPRGHWDRVRREVKRIEGRL